MKKSRDVRLTLVPVLAASALAAGCGSRSQDAQGWQACVDQAGVVADDRRCEDERRASHPAGYAPLYHWYYYPSFGGGYTTAPGIGQRVPPGGQFSATPFSGSAHRGPVTSGVSRGGFGTTASGKAGA